MFRLAEKFEKLMKENGRITINGLGYGERAFLLSTIKEKSLLICLDSDELNKTKEQLLGLGKKVLSIDEKLPLLFGMNETANPLFKEYYNVLSSIATENFDVILILPQVLMQKLPSLERIKQSVINIKVGKSYNLEDLILSLKTMGYVRQDMVSSSGEFSLRGDILDVFLTNFSSPIRISFFDDEVEKINTFNVNSYTIGEVFDSVEILPSTLALINENEKEEVVKTIKNSLIKTNFQDETMLRLNDICSFQIDSLENNLSSVSSVFFLPFCEFFNSTILDYFDSKSILFFNEPRRILDLLDIFYKEFNESWQSLYFKGEYLLEHKQFYVEKSKIFSSLKSKKAASFNRTFENNNIFESENSLNVRVLPQQKYFTDFNELVKDVINFSNDNKTIVLSCATPLTINKVGNLLKVAKLDFKQIDNISNVDGQGIFITEQNIPSSVLLFDLGFLIIGSTALNANPVSVIKTERKDKPTFLPQVGDYVVHQIHGVGKCIKIEKLKLSSSYRDYFVLEYSGGDVLYVPTENVDILSSFVGEANPKCNKIGGVEFYKTKQKVKESIKKMAFDLIKVYSYRQNNKGFRYSKDTYLQTAFEDAFEFEHTADQLQAIKDIKYDMESGKIMERLVCGDVGYGKTEVALVAAYKAIQDGKQVAIICPTTILSQQHYNTAISRMKDFGVNVAVINRFKTKKQQEQIIEDLAKGKIDLICGTHRLLSSDVSFKDLGLLILDEEQRFGVEDKDKIKSIKSTVDVLTMSATPIPRTLYMSLVGIRDISFLNTPPKDRKPIHTSVIDYSDNIVVDATQKELARGGQVLIIYNRVETIMDFYGKIKNLLPDVQIGVAHGQMNSKMLEDAIYKLYSGQTQVLISTVLIENGIDLPLANTLIVVDADKLGISQLYQIRGRIGRSTRSAYAYLTFAKNKVLTQDAYKRLDALMEFSDFGSGYKIAMKDLEIRGAGDVLGSQQHGHMQKVGYDLYVKLLNEAVSEIKGETVEELKEVKIDIAINAHLPREYIVGDENRISCYSKISKLKTLDEIKSLEKELKDMYGEVPKETMQLCYVALIKNLAQSLKVKSVRIDNLGAKVYFYNDILDTKLIDFLSKGSTTFVLNLTNMPIITLPNDSSIYKNQQNVINFLIKASQNK